MGKCEFQTDSILWFGTVGSDTVAGLTERFMKKEQLQKGDIYQKVTNLDPEEREKVCLPNMWMGALGCIQASNDQ